MKKSFKYKKIDLGTLEVKIPILEFGESSSNASIAITCCVHGNESSSLFIIEKLVQLLNNIKITGKIKIITVSNPIATMFNSRTSPKDSKDMNRSAPGNENGTTTDIICKEIIKEISECDYYIDLHEWEIPALLQCILIENENENVRKKNYEIMKVFNPEIVVQLDKMYRSSIYGYINIEKKIPGMAIELPNMNCISDEKQEKIIESLLRVFNYLNITQEEKENIHYINEKAIFDIKKVDRYIAKKQGLFFPLKELGQIISINEKVGYILDLNMEDKEMLSNIQEKGLIIHLSAKKIVNPGDLIFTIAENNENMKN